MNTKMKNNQLLFLIGLVIILVIGLFTYGCSINSSNTNSKKSIRENLGTSVMMYEPDTCQGGNFYTCDGKNYMQIQNLKDGYCKCKNKLAIKYPVTDFWKNIQTTFDDSIKHSDSHYTVNTLTIPEIKKEYQPFAYGTKSQLTLDLFEDIFNNNMMILVARDDKALLSLYRHLLQQTYVGNTQGFPDFYYIPGSVLVLEPRNETIYYMIDYPIKYTPKNFPNYVNKNSNPYQIKEIIERALRLMPQNSVFTIIDKN